MMAQEDINPEINENVSDEGVNATDNTHNEDVQIPEVEVEARSAGWVPKEEYDGDEHKWVDAGEFLRRGELFAKINKQSSEVKELRRTVQQLADHNQKIKERAFKDAIASLKAQKKEALIEGDADLVVDIDDRIDDVKAAEQDFRRLSAQEKSEVQEQIHPEFAEWTNRNSWYVNDAPMAAFADALGRNLAGHGKSPIEVLREVEKQVKAEFPHKFRNPNKDKPSSVESSNAKGGRTGGYTPTEEERQIARRFVRAGAFKTEQEYYKQLADMEKK